MTYQSQTYLQNIGLRLDDHLLEIQDENLAEEDHRELLKAPQSLFVSKSKDVIVSLHRITSRGRQKIEKIINVCWLVCLPINSCMKSVRVVVSEQ